MNSASVAVGRDVTRGSIPNLEVRPARSRDELEAAYRLVHAAYRQQGYLEEDREGMRLTVYNAFPDTVTFIAKEGREIVGTVSLVADTDVGLPMDEIYGEELNDLRSRGRSLAEVTMLANKSQRVSRKMPIFLQLMKQVFDYIWFILQADDACLACHPHHSGFYEKRILFEQFGEEKNYHSVQDNPAVALRLNFRTVKERYREDDRLWRSFFENRTPVRLLARRHRMTPEDLKYFFVTSTDIFREAAPHEIEALRLLYPECPWNRWSRAGKYNPVLLAERACGKLAAAVARLRRGIVSWVRPSHPPSPASRPSTTFTPTAETTMY